MTRYRDLRLGLDLLTTGASTVLPKALATPAFHAESVELESAARPWTHGAGVQGLGIARKVTSGVALPDLALKVYVERKRPLSQLDDPVPTTVLVPGVGELVTDVEAIGRVVPETFDERVRPAMPGAGLAHARDTAGTLGCLVRRRGDPDRLFLLSNAHVLALSGGASIGDAVLQPAPVDGGRDPTDRLATLTEFVPLDTAQTGFPNYVDAAIAAVAEHTDVQGELRILGIRPVAVSGHVRIGTPVKKVGRTTDLTYGEVRDVDYRARIAYRTSPYGQLPETRVSIGFRDQVLCTRYTAGGDSGSAVLHAKNDKLLGLHFAGSPSTSIFNRARHVFRLLDLELA